MHVNADRARREESGAALFIMVVSVVVAAGIGFALSAVSMGRQRLTEHRIGMEAALHVAEAGLSRGLAEANLPANRSNPLWPAAGLTIDDSDNPFDNVYAADFDSGDKSRSLMGQFVLEFARGDTDGIDNDGNGVWDAGDPDEANFVTIVSTGYRGEVDPSNVYKVRVMGTFQKVTNQFNIQAAVFIDDATPNVDMGSSKSYTVSGLDHDMYSHAVIPGAPKLPAIASTGVFNAADTAAIAAKSGTQITGTTPTYQNSNPNTMDFDSIIQFAADNVEPAHHVVGSGVNLPGPFGTPPGPTPASPATWEITYHDAGGPGNTVKFSGNTSGAGIWVVDGDLEIGGTTNFTGIIVVTGAVRFVGGGATKLVTGAVISGETASVDNLSTTGTIDLHFSNGAVTSAANALARFVPVGYQKLPSEL